MQLRQILLVELGILDIKSLCVIVWINKLQKIEQLSLVVLQWCACESMSIRAVA